MSLHSIARASGRPVVLELGDVEIDCRPAAAELVHRVVHHLLEATATDTSLEALRIQVVPGDAALTVQAQTRSSASTGIVLGRPGWPALYDRLQVAGAAVDCHSAPADSRLTVRAPLSNAYPRGVPEA